MICLKKENFLIIMVTSRWIQTVHYCPLILRHFIACTEVRYCGDKNEASDLKLERRGRILCTLHGTFRLTALVSLF